MCFARSDFLPFCPKTARTERNNKLCEHVLSTDGTPAISDRHGMTEEEVKKYINEVAFSGAEEFLDKYKDAGKDAGFTDVRPVVELRGLCDDCAA